jgi:hypothetical protein
LETIKRTLTTRMKENEIDEQSEKRMRMGDQWNTKTFNMKEEASCSLSK